MLIIIRMQEIVICAVYTSDISVCPEQKKFTKSRDIRLVHQCIARANKNSIAEQMIIIFNTKFLLLDNAATTGCKEPFWHFLPICFIYSNIEIYIFQQIKNASLILFLLWFCKFQPLFYHLCFQFIEYL
jgi:hypothetical protein